MMYKALLKFFALNRQLALPGIGSFMVETKPAAIDFTSRHINASQNLIVFNNEEAQPRDAFYDFLSAELNTSKLSAENIFAEFTGKLKDELNNNKPVYFNGIGSLTKQGRNAYSFQPEQRPTYFPVLKAERIIRKNTTHTVKVGEEEKTSGEMQAVLATARTVRKDNWWVAASILFAVGVAAIVAYYAFYI